MQCHSETRKIARFGKNKMIEEEESIVQSVKGEIKNATLCLPFIEKKIEISTLF